MINLISCSWMRSKRVNRIRRRSITEGLTSIVKMLIRSSVTLLTPNKSYLLGKGNLSSHSTIRFLPYLILPFWRSLASQYLQQMSKFWGKNFLQLCHTNFQTVSAVAKITCLLDRKRPNWMLVTFVKSGAVEIAFSKISHSHFLNS
jgi:hypothetical protein